MSKWIGVNKSLPTDDGQTYLIAWKPIEIKVDSLHKHYYGIAEFYKDTGWDFDLPHCLSGYSIGYEILAWQELPSEFVG